MMLTAAYNENNEFETLQLMHSNLRAAKSHTKKVQIKKINPVINCNQNHFHIFRAFLNPSTPNHLETT